MSLDDSLKQFGLDAGNAVVQSVDISTGLDGMMDCTAQIRFVGEPVVATKPITVERPGLLKEQIGQWSPATAKGPPKPEPERMCPQCNGFKNLCWGTGTKPAPDDVAVVRNMDPVAAANTRLHDSAVRTPINWPFWGELGLGVACVAWTLLVIWMAK